MNPLGYIGIARRAGLLKAGRVEVLKNIGRGKLLVLAKDMSKREREKFFMKLKKKVEVVEYGTKEELGRAIGKRPTAVLLFIDRGLAENFKKALETEEK